MIHLIDHRANHDPHINLALEEFCLRNLSAERPYIIVYINQPAVIVGRHQNILQEVNLLYAARTGLPIVRRITGGGAVYHDFGNLNFAFIENFTRRSLANIRQTIAPIQSALRKMDIPAVFNHRNDLFIADKKISGNAQFSNTKRILVHGTLLYDSDLDRLEQALNAPVGTITSKARKSVPSPVTNISWHQQIPCGLVEFHNRLLEILADLFGGLKTIQLDDADWQAVGRLSDEKYRSWAWNYGKAPVFQLKRHYHHSSGPRVYAIEVINGRIASFQFEKEAVGLNGLKELEMLLIGVPFHRETIRAIVVPFFQKGVGRKLNPELLADMMAVAPTTHKAVLQSPICELP